MRLLLFFLSLFLFEKNAVAVVHSAAGNHVQLVENQTVKLSERLSKTNRHHFFQVKKGLLFFKKSQLGITRPEPGHGDRAAAACLFFGLATIGCLVLTFVLLIDAFIIGALISIALSLIFGIFALHKRTNRQWAVFGGLLSSALSVLLGYLLFLFLSFE